MNVRFTLLPETLAVARLEGDDPLPSWARGSFVSLTRSHGELSVVCAEAHVPEHVAAARGWRCLRAEGPFPLDAVGVANSFIEPLAEAKISNLLIATYDTDYLLVDGAHLSRSIEVLEAAGHHVRT